MPWPLCLRRRTSGYSASRMPHRSAPPLFIVFNAALDGDDARAAYARVSARLRQAGRAHQVFWAQRPGDLAAAAVRAVQAARDAAGAVVAAGGDATLHTVAQAVWNARLPLGTLPVGAGPFGFSQAHGLPTDLDAATAALLQARAQPLTLGLLGGRLFLVSASVGLHPRPPAARETLRARTRRRLADLGSHLLALLRGRSLLTLELHASGASTVVRTRTLHICVSPRPAPAVPPAAPATFAGRHASAHASGTHAGGPCTQGTAAPGRQPPPGAPALAAPGAPSSLTPSAAPPAAQQVAPPVAPPSAAPYAPPPAASLATPLAVPFAPGPLHAATLPPQSLWHTLWRVLRGKAGQAAHPADADCFAFEQLTVRPHKPARPHRADTVRVTLDGHTRCLPMPLTFAAAPHPLVALLPPPGTEATACAPGVRAAHPPPGDPA